MAGSMNKVILLGRLGKDPQMSYTQGGAGRRQEFSMPSSVNVDLNRLYSLYKSGMKYKELSEEFGIGVATVWRKLKSVGSINRIEKHGMAAGQSKKRLYVTYQNMKRRCKNKNAHDYKRYGGAGVTICEQWDSSFLSFQFWAMSSGYNDGLTIDRIDGSRGYGPENCRWVTPHENFMSNKKSNKLSLEKAREIRSSSMSKKDLASAFGVKVSTIRNVLKNAIWRECQ